MSTNGSTIDSMSYDECVRILTEHLTSAEANAYFLQERRLSNQLLHTPIGGRPACSAAIVQKGKLHAARKKVREILGASSAS